MTIVVYKMDISPPSRTVLMATEILELKIETREINILAKEQFAPDYLQKNPIHSIPLLEDNKFVLTDSHAIIVYLVSKYGAEKRAQLYPNDLKDRAIVHQMLFLDASILFPRLLSIVKDVLYEKALSIDEKKVADVEEAYGFLEKYLEGSPFLAGERVTIADVACVATVSSLNVVVTIDERYQKLKQWLEILSNKTWYKKQNQQGVNDLAMLFTSQILKNAEDIVGFTYTCG